MLTFKENKIQIVRGLLEPLFLDTVQRLMMQIVSDQVKNPPAHFRPDPQCEKRYPLGRHFITEALLHATTPMVSKIAGMDLLPTYAFPVINFPGAELVRHTDRPACEVTATLTVVNEPNTIWPIFVEDAEKTTHRFDLSPGDFLIYDGINFPHWREPQDPGHFNISVFFHFVAIGGPYEAWHDRECKQYENLAKLYRPPTLVALFPDRQ